MKKGKITILIGVGTCLLALVMYPVLRNAWDMHCLDAKGRCLGTIYRAMTEKALEAEALGHGFSSPRTLSEILDEKTETELKKNGVDWRQIQYYPLADDAPDTNTILSLESGKYIITVRKGGAVFRSRRKLAEQGGLPRACPKMA